MSVFLVTVSVVMLIWASVLFVYRNVLVRLWREPVVRRPVLIIESDDWGPGPDSHAHALEQLCGMLNRCTDGSGRAAVMTVGVVLAAPDNAAIRDRGYREYARRTLQDPAFEKVWHALRRGRDRGVLALQLHGLEHLWPAAFMHALTRDDAVRQWVREQAGFDTGSLPSAIQSRWTDTSSLPSVPIEPGLIAAAVNQEIRLFEACFDRLPAVAVPPTFVWSAPVERAWSAGGVRFIITPGRRYTGRDASGRPAFVDRRMLNGDMAASGCTYLVRDVYFEPALGHRAEAALETVSNRFRLGRPALVETHRFNFVGDAADMARNLEETERLLATALARIPSLRFMSSEELGEAMRRRDADLVEHRVSVRLVFWLRRLAALGRLRKIAWLTGLVVPAGLLYLATQGRVRSPEEASFGVCR